MATDDIIVTARRGNNSSFFVFAFFCDDSGLYEPHPMLIPDADAPPPEKTYSFLGDCDSEASMAKALANKIASRPDSATNEYSGTIVAAGGGRFKSWKDAIFTREDPAEVGIHIPPESMANVRVFLHSHPPESPSNIGIDAMNRYPSDKDWAEMEATVATYPVLAGIKIGICGPDGETRLFSYSDRTTYKALTSAQMISGNSLPTALPAATNCVGL